MATPITYYPYLSGTNGSTKCNFSAAAITYQRYDPTYRVYSTWEDWAENDDAAYVQDWLSLTRVQSFTSDAHIFGPHRMFFGFEIRGDRTRWLTLREPTFFWLTYRYASDDRDPAEDQMQLYYCPWGTSFTPGAIGDYRALWHYASNNLLAPATKPFSHLSREHSEFEPVGLQLINTHLVNIVGPTWFVAISSAETDKPPMDMNWDCPYQHMGDPPLCPYGRPDVARYTLGSRFVGSGDGYERGYWPRIIVGGTGTERTVTPLIPGPPYARGGPAGSGHRTRV